MRTAVISLNLVVVLFFICFLTYTFVARKHLDGLARQFVTEKTLLYSAPIFEVAEESLKSRVVRVLLPTQRLATIQKEIATYRLDPARYVADLTQQANLALQPEKPNPLLAKVASIKDRIRAFYDNTLNALINDLRIFATSNLCAGLIAFCLAWRAPQKVRQSLVWFSFLMFVTVLYGSSMYLDNLTFFRILFRTHMGWGYAVLLCVILAGLYLDYGREWGSIEQSHSLETVTNAAGSGSQPDDYRLRQPTETAV